MRRYALYRVPILVFNVYVEISQNVWSLKVGLKSCKSVGQHVYEPCKYHKFASVWFTICTLNVYIKRFIIYYAKKMMWPCKSTRENPKKKDSQTSRVYQRGRVHLSPQWATINLHRRRRLVVKHRRWRALLRLLPLTDCLVCAPVSPYNHNPAEKRLHQPRSPSSSGGRGLVRLPRLMGFNGRLGCVRSHSSLQTRVTTRSPHKS